MNSEQEILFDAIADWKSNDDWQFADKEAAWKFFFQAGAASRDAEITELKAERDTFYMDYRIKCDVETKAAHVERDQLRAELVKALAACKAKDEAILKAAMHLRPTCFDLYEELQSALAIKPDDDALKTYLGAPVATAMFNQHGTRWMHWKADLAHGTNLYSPKEKP